MRRLEKKLAEKEEALKYLQSHWTGPAEKLSALLEERGQPPLNGSVRLSDLIRRPGIGYADLAKAVEGLPAISAPARELTETELKYEGYLARQQADIRRFQREEEMLLPEDIDYMEMDNLRIEARQKLNRVKPRSLGQASRIPGVSPGDISVLMILMEKRRREKEEA